MVSKEGLNFFCGIQCGVWVDAVECEYSAAWLVRKGRIPAVQGESRIGAFLDPVSRWAVRCGGLGARCWEEERRNFGWCGREDTAASGLTGVL